MRTTSRGWLLRVGVKRKSSFKEIKNRKRQKVYFKIEPTEKQGDVVERAKLGCQKVLGTNFNSSPYKLCSLEKVTSYL